MTSWHLVLNGETSVVIYAGNADDDDEIGVGSRAFNTHRHVGTQRKQVIQPVRLLGVLLPFLAYLFIRSLIYCLTIPVRPVISTSIGLIFGKFSWLAEPRL